MAAAARRLIPLFDRVLVERIVQEAKSKGGILLPETAKVGLNEGTVVAVGTGSRAMNGEVVPCQVKVGDRVLLPEFGGTTIKDSDKEFVLFRDSDILATIQ